MILEPIIQNEVSQKEKKICILTHTHTHTQKEHIWVSSNEGDPRAYYTEWSKSERKEKPVY